MGKKAESSSSSRTSWQETAPKRRKKLEEEPQQITMKEEEKQHYLHVMWRDIFPEIISARLAWEDQKIWSKMVQGYNHDIDQGLVDVDRCTACDLIQMGKELEWCSRTDQQKSSCKFIVPCFPANFGYISTYRCTEQPGSGLAVSWNEIGSSSKEHDDLGSYNSEDLGRKLASQLLKLEIGDSFTFGDFARATFIFNYLLLGSQAESAEDADVEMLRMLQRVLRMLMLRC